MRAGKVYVLSESPLVIAGSFAVLEELPTPTKPYILLFHLPGWVWAKNFWKFALRCHRFQRRTRCRVIVCTNELSEAKWLRSVFVEAHCFNHNLHARENFFSIPVTGLSKQFNAVYAAALEPYKRLPLASAIENLYVLTYKSGHCSWCLQDFCPSLAGAQSNTEFLPEEEVRRILWQAHCGLALSAREGAMWSVAEYMLCGLPVVSTPSRGGRAFWAEPGCWFEVQPDTKAIAQTVTKVVNLRVSPQKVRDAFIRRLNGERTRYASFMSAQLGVRSAPHILAEKIWGGASGIFKNSADALSFRGL